jgi:hypothetical protein
MAQQLANGNYSTSEVVAGVTSAGADEDDVSVTYGDGILTVSVGISQARHAEKRIHVESGI